MPTDQLDVKALLKQVYLAHNTKIKGLEEENENLRNKLEDAERKLKNSESECKRCVELEKAFKGCQAALHEQSKWFENLGQKFSAFDHPGSKDDGNKTTKEINISEFHEEISSNTSLLSSLLPEKSTSNKQNFLKNLMSLTPEKYQDSLDLNTAPFIARCGQEYSTMNSDSMILAPDTLDIIGDIPPTIKAKDSPKDNQVDDNSDKQKNKNVVENVENKKVKKSPEVVDCQTSIKPAKKRSLTGPIDQGGTTKKMNKGSDSSEYFKEINPELTSKRSSSESNPVGTKALKDKKSSTDVKEKETKNKSSDVSSSKTTHHNVTSNIKKIPALTIEICKAGRDVSQKSVDTKDCLDGEVANVTKNSMFQVSPSLLPLNDKKDKNLPVKSILENEDIYDFQTPIVSKKQQPEDDNAWTACDKKKLKKTAPPPKLKSTSRFKMSLDALPPDYKKPVYRQTKLSKSIFQPKSSASNACKENQPDTINSPSSSPKDSIFGNLKSGKNATVDFDATCIPDNYEYQIIPSGSKTKSKIASVESDNSEDVILLNDQSCDESSNDSSLIIKINNHGKKSPKECHIDEEDTFEDFLKDGPKKLACSENMNSFDRLPKKQEPNYKYKEGTVRKKAERKQLNGFDCKECEKYYAELGLSDKEKQERLKQCSRHRSKFAAPATPEHFWELEFPDTQECKARGYMNETQKVKLKTLRRKPL